MTIEPASRQRQTVKTLTYDTDTAMHRWECLRWRPKLGIDLGKGGAASSSLTSKTIEIRWAQDAQALRRLYQDRLNVDPGTLARTRIVRLAVSRYFSFSSLVTNTG